jgi:hypothetical protein
MCEQCEELDKKISHYRKLASSLTDEPTLLGIKKLIEKAEVRKRALHPDQPLIERNAGISGANEQGSIRATKTRSGECVPLQITYACERSRL